MSYESLEEWAGRRSLMLAIVFTDMVGSTALRKELGDERMATITREHFAKATFYISQYEGYRIKTNGDEVMSVFWTAVDALNYCLDLYEDTGDHRVRIRSAIHIGTVSIIDGDIDATTAAIVARIMKTSKGASITMSEDAYVQILQVKSRRHSGLKVLPRRVQLDDFPEITRVRTVLTAKMREENRRRLAIPAKSPTSSPTVPDRASVISPRRVTVPPPPGAEPTKGRFGDIGSLSSRPTLKPQSTPQPEWWKILLGNQDSRPVSNSLLAALLRNDEEDPKR